MKIWRKGGSGLDRGEIRFWSWLTIVSAWAIGLFDLAISGELGTAYGQLILIFATLIGILLGLVVAIGYLFWPQKVTQVRTELVSESEKLNFRNSLFEEIRTILEKLESEWASRIPYPVWISKTDAEKVSLLGEDAYASLRQFYRTIDGANAVLEDSSIEGQLRFLDGTSRRMVIEDAERIFAEVDWLRERSGVVQPLLERLRLDLAAVRGGGNDLTPNKPAEEGVEPEEPEFIPRNFGKATVVFKLKSTTRWFHVGLLDSRNVKVVDYSPTDVAQPEPTDYPNQSFFGISQGEEGEKQVQELEMSVKAIFEVYSGDNITIFTRKSNDGTLKIQVFDTDGILRGEFQTSRTSLPDNFDEFGIAFPVVDSI